MFKRHLWRGRWNPYHLYRAAIQVWDEYTGLALPFVDKRPRELFVVFRTSELKRSQMMREFQHVAVFALSETPDKKQSAIVQVEHIVNRTSFGVVFQKETSVRKWLKILERMGATVVRCNIAPIHNRIQFLPRLNPYNCIELTKQCLGVRLWGVYTPWRLYKALAKRNDCLVIINPKEF